MKGRLVIPIYNEQADLITYVGRAIDSSGPSTGSQPACMKVRQAGYPRVVALMGSTLSARQEKLLEDHFQRWSDA
jgi:DNA primase